MAALDHSPGLSAVIFDFDGTITIPTLDFDAIRAEIGIESGTILEEMASWNEARRASAFAIIERHERLASEEARLQDGAVETLSALRAAGHPISILTRNARPSVLPVLARFGIEIDAIRTREDGAIKPSPEPVLSLCEELGADVSVSWMVGDHLYDIMSGKSAGATTVLTLAGPDHGEESMLEACELADYQINQLSDLLEIVGSETIL